MENMIVMLIMTALPLVLFVLGILCAILLYKPLKKLCIRMAIRKNTIGMIAVFFLTIPLFFVGFLQL